MPATLLGRSEATKIVKHWLAEATELHRNQRLTVRKPLLRPATISRGGLEVRALCRNISSHGIQLLQSDCPPVEDTHTVCIWLKRQVIELPVEVEWTKPLGGVWWACGGRVLENSFAESIDFYLNRWRHRLSAPRSPRRYPYCRRYLAIPGPKSGFHEDPLVWSDDAVPRAGDMTREYLRGSPQVEVPDHLVEHVASVVSLDISERDIHIVSEYDAFHEGQEIYLDHVMDQRKGMVRGLVRFTEELENGYHSSMVDFGPSFV